MVKKKSKAKPTKIHMNVKRYYKQVLTGKLLAIDPSTGSNSSMPGYAVFDKGELVESGTIQVKPYDKRNQKLYSITETLWHEFDEPDVLAIENIPPVSFRSRGSKAMSGWSITALQRAVGAIISCFNCDYIEVPPSSWGKYKFEGYMKSDENDAVCIGLCVLAIARQVAESNGEMVEELSEEYEPETV